MDPRRIVREGYDRIAERYFALVSGDDVADEVRDQQRRYLAVLLDGLADSADVLDLGCGAGVPVTKTLAERFNVTGVDFSARQLELARRNVPEAAFIQADMTAVEFPADSFNGVSAFWSIIHVPRDDQSRLFASISRWLRPGGLFVAPMGVKDHAANYEEDWLGAPMYWSFFDAARNREMINTAGLEIVADTVETLQDGVDGPETFQWIVAKKPA